jgi:hypothetical protein
MLADDAAFQLEVQRRHGHGAEETRRRHFRKISREINRVATKPISSSIFPSRDKGLRGWLEVTGNAKVIWLAGGDQTTGGPAGEERAPPVVRGAAAARVASGGLTLVERERRDMLAVLDAAARRADAALRHHIANGFLTLAAAQRDAELELQFVEGIHSFGDGGSDLPVGH